MQSLIRSLLYFLLVTPIIVTDFFGNISKRKVCFYSHFFFTKKILTPCDMCDIKLNLLDAVHDII